jgi:hypothetical protein
MPGNPSSENVAMTRHKSSGSGIFFSRHKNFQAKDQNNDEAIALQLKKKSQSLT